MAAPEVLAEVAVTEEAGVARRGEAVEIGLPVAAGDLRDADSLVVLDERGDPLPSQFRTSLADREGRAKAVHGLCLVDLDAHASRTLRVARGRWTDGRPLLEAVGEQMRITTGGMRVIIGPAGDLLSLTFDEEELLDHGAGPSLRLGLSAGPAPEPVVEPGGLRATPRENGPVRAIVRVKGVAALPREGRRVEVEVDADYVFYAGREEIHVRPMLLGAVTEATTINEWSLSLYLRNGRRMAYGRGSPLIRDDPHDEHMTFRGLEDGWACWRVGERGSSLAAWSADFQRQRNGLVETRVLDRERRRLEVKLGRVESLWGYPDVAHVGRPVVINRGSWRRWELVLAGFRGDEDGSVSEATRRWAAPLRAVARPSYYKRALRPLLRGEPAADGLRERVRGRCLDFICREPERWGSIYGGWDGPNQMFIEPGVARGEFGEYLLQEAFRSGDRELYRAGLEFGRCYRDRYCFTIPAAERGEAGAELGGARSRQHEHVACPIRSYRGAVLLAYMHQQTGDDRYLEALRRRADYHLRHYPHSVGRLSMSCGDSAFMAAYLDRPELFDKAGQSARHSLDRHRDPRNGFFEHYDESSADARGKFPPRAVPGGAWIMGDFLEHANASPEMTAYNIIGWYRMLQWRNADDALRAGVRQVCDWFCDRQRADGAWPYPHHNSRTAWGHGCLQDALAMIYAYRLFGEPRYLAAARRSVAFAQHCLETEGRIPLLLGLKPHEETEDSLTYFYGLEALAELADIGPAAPSAPTVNDAVSVKSQEGV